MLTLKTQERQQTYRELALDAIRRFRVMEDFGGKNLTPEQIEEQSQKAFSHKTEKIKMEVRYLFRKKNMLNCREEKENYKSEMLVFEFDETEDDEGQTEKKF